MNGRLMDAIILAFNHGNGPYTRAYQLAKLVKQYLGINVPIIIPWIYPNQDEILSQFGRDYLLSRELGNILSPALYWGGSFIDYAKKLPLIGEYIERKFIDASMGSLRVRDMNGRELDIRVNDPIYINAYPVLRLPSYTLSLHEHVILGNYVTDFGEDIGTDVIKWFRRVESGILTFVSAPAGACAKGLIFSDAMVIPPAIYKYRRDVYKFRGVKILGSGVSGANAALSSISGKSRRKIMVTRGGLATVWESWFQEIPVLIPKPRPGEDPEIIYNVEVFEKWKMAHLMSGDWLKDVDIAIKYAAARTYRLIPRPLGLELAAAEIVRHIRNRGTQLSNKYEWLCRESAAHN
ncbi:MAG: hypothetical protein AT710_06930 [Thermocladium sp. ECH_B]|jgi:hypothetical protein|nr:MAG: hypothetical protein AT710_06930 [Thermocladium sp. ECH_B]